MFKEYEKIYLQKDARRLDYAIYSNEKVVGKVQETNNPSKKIGHGLIVLLSLLVSRYKRHFIESLEFEVLDKNGNRLGIIEKGIGFHKDLILYAETGKHIATIKSSIELNSPTLTAIDPEGNNLIKAKGSFGATDFSVINSGTDKETSTIKKRSLVYKTVKETLFNNDVYHIENSNPKEEVTLALIGMAVALDMYFHNK
ncbi:hypothetical protein [Virgibacillus sp. YIM 98842]|uniref:hypothetical protein n=1 Tax=Virgibacillus sp. YIM 98842 TaxID=2663533 RepID=UPI0013DB80C8|nr:hypothetical protein [Virgibacillus sp. YIM 98842]